MQHRGLCAHPELPGQLQRTGKGFRIGSAPPLSQDMGDKGPWPPCSAQHGPNGIQASSVLRGQHGTRRHSPCPHAACWGALKAAPPLAEAAGAPPQPRAVPSCRQRPLAPRSRPMPAERSSGPETMRGARAQGPRPHTPRAAPGTAPGMAAGRGNRLQGEGPTDPPGDEAAPPALIGVKVLRSPAGLSPGRYRCPWPLGTRPASRLPSAGARDPLQPIQPHWVGTKHSGAQCPPWGGSPPVRCPCPCLLPPRHRAARTCPPAAQSTGLPVPKDGGGPVGDTRP